MLAKTPCDFFLLGDLDLHGSKTFALVGTVAKWLRGGQTAGTPPVNAGFHFHDLRGLLTNMRFAHGEALTPRHGNHQNYSDGNSDTVLVNRVTLNGAMENAW